MSDYADNYNTDTNGVNWVKMDYVNPIMKKTELAIESLEKRVKELEASKKRGFWYAFEHAAMSPENRNINQNWNNFLNWEGERYPELKTDRSGPKIVDGFDGEPMAII